MINPSVRSFTTLGKGLEESWILCLNQLKNMQGQRGSSSLAPLIWLLMPKLIKVFRNNTDISN